MSQELVAVRDIPIPTIDPAAFDQLDAMPEGFSISSEYLEFEKVGESHRVFWVGMTTMWSSKQKKEIPAAVFLWRETPTSGPKKVINSGVNIVMQLEKTKFTGQPIPMQITYLGEKKAGTGWDFKAFEIVVLDGNRAPAPRTDQQKRNSENMNDNTDLHSDEPFGEKKPKAKTWKELLTELATETKSYMPKASGELATDISAAMSAARELFKATSPKQEDIAWVMQWLNKCINDAKAELQTA